MKLALVVLVAQLAALAAAGRCDDTFHGGACQSDSDCSGHDNVCDRSVPSGTCQGTYSKCGSQNYGKPCFSDSDCSRSGCTCKYPATSSPATSAPTTGNPTTSSPTSSSPTTASPSAPTTQAPTSSIYCPSGTRLPTYSEAAGDSSWCRLLGEWSIRNIDGGVVKGHGYGVRNECRLDEGGPEPDVVGVLCANFDDGGGSDGSGAAAAGGWLLVPPASPPTLSRADELRQGFDEDVAVMELAMETFGSVVFVVVCSFCRASCLRRAVKRREDLGLPVRTVLPTLICGGLYILESGTATDAECKAAERRDKVGLPRDSTEAELEAAEYRYRRQQLGLPQTATDEECAAEEKRRWAAEAAEAHRQQQATKAWHRQQAKIAKANGTDLASRNRANMARQSAIMRGEGRSSAKTDAIKAKAAANHTKWEAKQAERKAKHEREMTKINGRIAEKEAKRAAKHDEFVAKKEARVEEMKEKAKTLNTDKNINKRKYEAQQRKEEVAQARREAQWEKRKHKPSSSSVVQPSSSSSSKSPAASSSALHDKKQQQPQMNVLTPMNQALGAYHTKGVDGGVFYKGKKLAAGGQLRDLGGGYALGADGKAFFNGEAIEGGNALEQNVAGSRFYQAGNGYAVSGGKVYYNGKEVEGASVNQGECELVHLGDGWSRDISGRTYLYRGKAIVQRDARHRCPHFGKEGKTISEGLTPATVDNSLVPEEERLGTYHMDGAGVAVFYKGEKISDVGGLKDLGGGYARANGGKVFFHGKEMETSNHVAQLVAGDRFVEAGNGYAIAGIEVFYNGERVKNDLSMKEGAALAPSLEHLGDGWCRMAGGTYFHHGEVFKGREARFRCPHYHKEKGESVPTAEGGTLDNSLISKERKLGTYHQKGDDGGVWYKGEKIAADGGGLKNLGGGYATAQGGKAWFNGKELLDGSSLVAHGKFTNVGDGFAQCGRQVFFHGEKIDKDLLNPTAGLELLGQGWARNAGHYYYRGEGVDPREARFTCPHYTPPAGEAAALGEGGDGGGALDIV